MKTLMDETGKIANLNLVALAAAFALALAFGPVLAATIVVPSGANPEIQDGIDAASSGDTVSLKKSCGSGPFCGFNGIYHQGVDIDKKLTLQCNGAILDADVPLGKSGTTDGGATPTPGPARLGGDGVEIMSDGDGTTIVNCTIRNFASDGIEVNDADGVTIRNNTLINNDSIGLDINSSDDYLVERNTASDNDGDGFEINDSTSSALTGIIRRNIAESNEGRGFDVWGGDVEMLNNRAHRNRDDGIRVFGQPGTSLTITGNRAEINDEQGFEINDASKGTVSRNFARNNRLDGFEIGGDDALIERNVALFNGDSKEEGRGFAIFGEDQIVNRNLAIGHAGDGFKLNDTEDITVTRNRSTFNKIGFDFDCGNNSPCGVVMHNRALGNRRTGFQFEDFDEGTVSHNKSIDGLKQGFKLEDSSTNTFINNLARNNHSNGFRIDAGSDSNTFERNKSFRNGRDGFRISDSDSTTLIKNTVKKNNEDGFDLDDSVGTVTMIGNRAIRNGNTGIENNGGFDTTLTDNTMKGNGIDLAGKGDDDSGGPPCTFGGPPTVAATDLGGNVFSTGGFDTCVPEGSDTGN